MGLPPLQAQLLFNRGITEPAEVEGYLTPDASLLHDPFLLPDMGEGVARLRRAIDSREVVAVFGDFDTDGVTGTALLTQAFSHLGLKVIPYLPHRVTEGHGLNLDAVRMLADQGASVLVTVDTGTTSLEEVEAATGLGIDTVITDHHTLPPQLPPAVAVINPKRPESAYPFDGLAGVGMAFKLAQALYQSLGRDYPEDLLELVALGTVADIAPLTNENRYLVREGLRSLNATQRPGLQELIRLAGLRPGSIDTEAFAYGLVPRLNAAGRLDHASTSLKLLVTSSTEEAFALAQELDERNVERRRLTREGVAEAMAQVESQQSEAILLVGSSDFSPGIVGLLAGRLAEGFYRPAIAMSYDEGLVRGSARSIPIFDIAHALRQCADLFIRFGGHPQAAGFTMRHENLEELQRRLRAIALKELEGEELQPSIAIDAQVPLSALAGRTYRFLESLAPFGQDNPTPVFLTRNAEVVNSGRFGANDAHLKLRLREDGVRWDAIAFNWGDPQEKVPQRIDLVYTLGVDRFGPEDTLRLTLLDFGPAETQG